MTQAHDYEKISDECWTWLCLKYNIVDLVKPKYIIKQIRGFRYRYTTREIVISCHSTWHTYKRKTIGLYANLILCKVEENLHLVLVHEMTHYIQHANSSFNVEQTIFSEIETTQNEIEYAKEHYPHLYKKLSKFPIKKKKEKKVITIDENIIKLEEKKKKLLSKYKRMFNRIKKIDSTIKRLEKRKMKNGN